MRRGYINLVAAERVAQSNHDLGRDITQSSRELGERLADISRDEIRARDRVDISLEEYERMKKTIDRLSLENSGLRDVLSRISIPVDAPIIHDSIHTEYSHDHMRFLTHWRITFDVEG